MLVSDANVLFVSAGYSYSAGYYTLPSHHEGCDCVESEQDLGYLCYTLDLLTLQPPLANGKRKEQRVMKGVAFKCATV